MPLIYKYVPFPSPFSFLSQHLAKTGKMPWKESIQPYPGLGWVASWSRLHRGQQLEKKSQTISCCIPKKGPCNLGGGGAVGSKLLRSFSLSLPTIPQRARGHAPSFPNLPGSWQSRLGNFKHFVILNIFCQTSGPREPHISSKNSFRAPDMGLRGRDLADGSDDRRHGRESG